MPKGVAVTHRNVTQLFDGLEIGIELAPGQVWTQFHSYAFDFSVWEIWGALLHGGRLVVVPDAVARSAGRLPRPAGREQVTVLTQTPSAAAVLSHEGLESAALVIGAEACPPELVDRWAPGRVMVNVYGPTETTMWLCKSTPLTPGSGCAADRFADRRGGVLRTRRVAATRAGPGWSANCIWRAAVSASDTGAGPP